MIPIVNVELIKENTLFNVWRVFWEDLYSTDLYIGKSYELGMDNIEKIILSFGLERYKIKVDSNL